LFKEANEFYKKGKYVDSIKQYEAILEKNIKNGYIYFNLGNAYFKNNQLGKAILNYERAKIFLPSDNDLNFNLRFANDRKMDKIKTEVMNPFATIILFLYNIFELNSLFWLSWILFIILIGSVITKWYYKNISFSLINQKIFNYCGIIFLVFVLVLIIKANHLSTSQYAIVQTKEVKVKSGPSQDYTDIFTLHEGTKVKIRKKGNEWHVITLPNGFSGYILKEHIEQI
jgi:tetratricopeptide (TPR) repeat protein